MWNDLTRYLLLPYTELAGLFFNHSFAYITGVGYVERNGSYMIGSDCLGIRFTTVLFLFCGISFIKYFNGIHKLKWVLCSLTGSLAVGFLVNCLRVLGSIPFTGSSKFNLIHASQGITLYFFTFALTYHLLKKYCERREQPNEHKENI